MKYSMQQLARRRIYIKSRHARLSTIHFVLLGLSLLFVLLIQISRPQVSLKTNNTYQPISGFQTTCLKVIFMATLFILSPAVIALTMIHPFTLTVDEMVQAERLGGLSPWGYRTLGLWFLNAYDAGVIRWIESMMKYLPVHKFITMWIPGCQLASIAGVMLCSLFLLAEWIMRSQIIPAEREMQPQTNAHNSSVGELVLIDFEYYE
jgi:hypothetical protein